MAIEVIDTDRPVIIFLQDPDKPFLPQNPIGMFYKVLSTLTGDASGGGMSASWWPPADVVLRYLWRFTNVSYIITGDENVAIDVYLGFRHPTGVGVFSCCATPVSDGTGSRFPPADQQRFLEMLVLAPELSGATLFGPRFSRANVDGRTIVGKCFGLLYVRGSTPTL